jgi:hypothetical protein
MKLRDCVISVAEYGHKYDTGSMVILRAGSND